MLTRCGIPSRFPLYFYMNVVSIVFGHVTSAGGWRANKKKKLMQYIRLLVKIWASQLMNFPSFQGCAFLDHLPTAEKQENKLQDLDTWNRYTAYTYRVAFTVKIGSMWLLSKILKLSIKGYFLVQISFHPAYKMQHTGTADRKIKGLHVSVTSCCMTY